VARVSVPPPPGLWPAAYRLLVGGPWPPDRPGAERFVEACRGDELLPLLARSAGQPEAIGRALERSSALLRLYDERARLFTRARAQLEPLLAGEKVLWLKGADYGPRLYGDPGLRPMKDFDLLVPADCYDAVCQRLEADGLRRVFPGAAATRAAGYHERAFAFQGLQVEVHAAFIQHARHRVDYAGVWERAILDPVTGWGRLEDVDALVYHALAMAADQFQAKLIRYVDLRLLLSATSADPVRAVERAWEWRSGRPLYGALRMLAWLFPDWDEPRLQNARRALLPPRARRAVDRWILPRPAEWGRRRLPPRPTQVWRKLGLIDGWRRRVAFVAGWLRDELEGRWQQRRHVRRTPSR
jgi:hypothetical protein